MVLPEVYYSIMRKISEGDAVLEKRWQEAEEIFRDTDRILSRLNTE